MEVENINVEEFLPAKNPIKLKNVKRKAVSESGEGMDVEQIPSQSKPKRRKGKKLKKSNEPNESKVNMRKIAVPAHRYNLKIFLFGVTIFWF